MDPRVRFPGTRGTECVVCFLLRSKFLICGWSATPLSKKLVIAEKPSVARDIAKALGGFTARGKVFEVHDLGLCGLAVHVEKHDLVHEVAKHQAQCNVAANATSADNDNLARLVWLLNGHCFPP